MNPYYFWSKQKYWLKYKRESFKHKLSERQALDGNPSLWLLGNHPNRHVGSRYTESVGPSVDSIAKAVWSTWACKFHVNLKLKFFCPFFLTADFDLWAYPLFYCLIDLKEFISLCIYLFFAEIIFVTSRNIIRHQIHMPSVLWCLRNNAFFFSHKA